MQVTANLLWPGNKILVGKSACEVLETTWSGRQLLIRYKTPKGAIKTKTVAGNATIKMA